MIKYIIGVSGSRRITSLPQSLKDLLLNKASKIVHGGAIGFDSLVEEFAKANNIPTQVIKPNYNVPYTHPTFGYVSSPRQAPIARNQDIVNASQIMIGGLVENSRGTSYTINFGLSKGLPCYVYHDGEFIFKRLHSPIIW